jgi:hypothetical protein
MDLKAYQPGSEKMQPILQFVEAFVPAEFEALVAQYSERDEAVFRAKRARVEEFFGRGMQPELRRPDRADEDWFAAGKRMIALNTLAPRTLFQIKAYQHPNYQRLYRVYMSSSTAPRGKGPLYFKNYFVSDQGGQFKIVSHYDLDLITDQAGNRLNDGGLTWIWNDGEVLETLGDFVQSQKFQAPDDPAQRAEYEAE